MNLLEKLKSKLDQANVWKKKLTLKRNEYLKVSGEKNTNIYYVIEGSLRAYIDDGVEEYVIRLGYKDNFITSLESFIKEEASDVYIQAIKKTQLLMVDKLTFMELINSSTENMMLWQTMHEELIYQQLEREKDILIRSPKDRYDRVMERSPHVFQEIPLKHIASYLRMTPETLSRLRKS